VSSLHLRWIRALCRSSANVFCKQEVTGSIPVGSINSWGFQANCPPSRYAVIPAENTNVVASFASLLAVGATLR
jgi:hypothetical protein